MKRTWAILVVIALAAPSRARAETTWVELRDQGQQETLAGAILLPVAVGMAGVGSGLLADNFNRLFDPSFNYNAFWSGVGLTVAGSIGVLIAIPLLIAGAVHKKQARSHLHTADGAAPDPSRWSGAQLVLRF